MGTGMGLRQSRGWVPGALMGAGVAGLLLFSACGAGTGASVDVSPSAAPPSLVKPPPDKQQKGGTVDRAPWASGEGVNQAPDCPDESARTSCIYGSNQAQVFTGPNQLGPAAYTLRGAQLDAGEWAVRPPQTWTPTAPSPSDRWAAIDSDGMWTGSAGQFWYDPPPNLPADDILWYKVEDPYSSGDYDTCGTPVYSALSCDHSGDKDVNFFFWVDTYPLTVAVQNNVATQGDVLTLSGSPEYAGPHPDPVGGTAQSVAPAATEYFGMYLAGPFPYTNTFSAKYTFPETSVDLAGTSISLNAVITAPGVLDKSSSCQVSLGSTTQTVFCDLALIGGLDPNTLTVDIHQ